MKKIISFSIYFILWFCAGSQSLAFEVKSQNLEAGWQYRWGDSPIAMGVPLWTQDGQDEHWKGIKFPSNPPDRGGRNNVWYRVKLPLDTDPGDYLFIYSIDLITEVYLEGKKIYSYGHFEDDGTGKFEGWPWHMIALPHDYLGKTLYFRIYSDYPDIGLWGEVALGSEGSHIAKIIQGDLSAVAVGSFFIFFGLILLILASIRLKVGLFLMGVLLINLGFIPVGTSHLKQLLYFDPLGWQYFSASSYFILPVSIAGLIQVMYGKGKAQINQWIWLAHSLFLVLALSCSLAGVTKLSTTYIYFDAMALVSFFLLALFLQLETKAGDTNKKLVALSLWVLYFILLYNGLVAHDILPFTPSSEYIGPIFFILTIGAIMLREYGELKQGLKSRTQELEELNLTLESRIYKRTQALELSNRTKDQFFTIIAHDLKGPVGSLSMLFRQFVKDKETVPPELVPAINKSLGGVYDLLENLLTWARGQKGELIAKPKHFEVAEAIAASIEITNGARVKKNIALEFEAESQCFIFADQPMATTIIRNFLSNAVKFTPVGGKISISIQENSQSVKVIVSDSGVGISREIVPLLFEIKDYKSLKHGTSGEKGTGLGLLLCKEFALLNGGRVGVTSKPGAGSTFWVDLPKGQASRVNLEATESEAESEWFGQMKILLVEDEQIPMQAALELLHKFGLKVDTATSGDLALELYKKTDYNLVFMDIGLPKYDGVEALKKLEAAKSVSPYKVALTSYTRAEMTNLFGKTSFDRFLSKPLSKNDLLDVLQETLTKEME
ncbi:MAG: hybrid sensor histidine kinase/response regulator [SAR324 cluster bacterium]|nr:hybrid sensor histidine kinase/response regulator [SAR324 cluster bacterium]